MIRVDVAIAGGGPAGAAAAIALARRGYRVLVAEASDGRGWRIGEGLPPSTWPLLRELGVLARVLADGHRSCLGTVAFWGGDTAHVEDAIFGLDGGGLLLDRARFDASLRTAARDAGAALAEGARLRLTRQGDARAPHELEMRIGTAAPQPLRARWLIDAAGRAAGLARACRARRILHDRLLACHQRLAGSKGRDRDGRIWVEAVADGWWYSVLLPSGDRLIVFLSDPDPAARRMLLQGDGLWRKLALAPRLHALCTNHGWRPSAHAQCTDASNAELDRAGGERWLAVGDAALTFDPLASKGIAIALHTGLRAAATIAGADQGDATAIDAYVQHLRAIHLRYRDQRRTFYAAEGRWADCEFWTARRLQLPRRR